MIEIDYSTDSERDEIIAEQLNKGLYLTKDVIYPDRNYLVFDETPLPEQEPTELEKMELHMYEAVAEVYEEQLVAQLDTYEAIAEMYELLLVGGEA